MAFTDKPLIEHSQEDAVQPTIKDQEQVIFASALLEEKFGTE
jgi:hypothetical protein